MELRVQNCRERGALVELKAGSLENEIFSCSRFLNRVLDGLTLRFFRLCLQKLCSEAVSAHRKLTKRSNGYWISNRRMRMFCFPVALAEGLLVSRSWQGWLWLVATDVALVFGELHCLPRAKVIFISLKGMKGELEINGMNDVGEFETLENVSPNLKFWSWLALWDVKPGP